MPLRIQYVKPAVSTLNCGIIFDKNFNFREHISEICRTCYHIRDLCHTRVICVTLVSICVFLSPTKTIASALVINRFPFQKTALKDITILGVQNCLARVVTSYLRFTQTIKT